MGGVFRGLGGISNLGQVCLFRVASKEKAMVTSLAQGVFSESIIFCQSLLAYSIFIEDITRFNIDTNNYIESWHLLLKRDYLKLMRKQRVDVLVHILVDQVEPDLRREEAQVYLGFDAPRLQKQEKASKKLANAIERGELDSMIEYCEDGQDKVY